MLMRRLLSGSPSPKAFLRPFSSTAVVLSKTPSLADITPDGSAAFEARQKEFRAKTAELQRRKESQSAIASSRNSTSSLFPMSADRSDDALPKMSALGSLNTHSTEARSTPDDKASSGRKGALSSLIYGTHEGQQMDKEIEKSFSEVLARGKYVHSIVFHEVKPDKVDQYVELVGNWYPRMAKSAENRVNLVGSWRTEVGDCNTFGKCHHISPKCIWRAYGVPLTIEQCTSGSTSGIKDTTLRFTRLPLTPNSPSLTRS
jgi:hypothetical protein